MAIVLFDGVCNLCDTAVQFIIQRDKANYFKFASLQSEMGQKFLKKYTLPVQNFDSFVLIENDKIYQRSSAALRVAYNLKGWSWAYYFGIIFPKFFRDFIYNIIAKNRYIVFGKKESCMLPTLALKEKFL